MGFVLTQEGFDAAVSALRKTYRIYAPVRKKGMGRFEGTDVVLYDEVTSAEEICLTAKSDYSFKEFLNPLSETLFFFTEAEVKAADLEPKKVLILLRSCDMHAVMRLDQIYLHNGKDADWFYARRRELVSFALIGCGESCENGFCVDMKTNRTEHGYLFSIDEAGGRYYIDVPEDEADAAAVETGTAAGAATAAEADAAAGKTGTACSKCGTAAGLAALFSQNAECVEDVAVRFVTENKVHVTIPEEVPASVLKAPFWDAYNTRCIACGRCNFVCPTCTCYTMQDVFYSDNGKVGERRRVGSSCMVDGYTDVDGNKLHAGLFTHLCSGSLAFQKVFGHRRCHFLPCLRNAFFYHAVIGAENHQRFWICPKRGIPGYSCDPDNNILKQPQRVQRLGHIVPSRSRSLHRSFIELFNFGACFLYQSAHDVFPLSVNTRNLLKT